MGGSIFNLKNTVPAEIGDQITTELSALVIAAKNEVQTGNRRLAQCLIDVAGPGEGLKNCAGLHNGWVFDNVLTEEAKIALLTAHATQWGVPDQSVQARYPFAAAMYSSFASSGAK
jgi:hypothetical protein